MASLNACLQRVIAAISVFRGIGTINSKAMSFQAKKRVTANRYIKVLGTGGSETPPSLFLFTDSERYMFNCGDNVERFCLEHKIRLLRLRNVFFTRNDWSSCTGGLPGMAMHMRSNNSLELDLYGPAGLLEYHEAIKSVIHEEKIQFKVTTVPDGKMEVYKDRDIVVTGIAVHAEKEENEPSDLALRCSDEEDNQDKLGAKRKKLSRKDSSVVYVCKLADIPGKFNRDKAAAMGLQPGPLCAKLINGQTVTVPNGTEIKPNDVISPPCVGPVFMIVDCPNELIMTEMLSSGELQKAISVDKPFLVVHMTPKNILESPLYQHWCKNMGCGVQHLFLHSSVCKHELAFKAGLKIQVPLNTISPNVFLLPRIIEEDEKAQLSLPKELSNNSRIGQLMLIHHFYPSRNEGWDESELLPSAKKIIESHIKAMDKDKKLKEETIPERSKDIPPLKYQASDNLPAVTFLGTGAAQPSKYRNVSSTLLHLSSGQFMLFDCGEGTVSQLKRCFGEAAYDIIRDLSCVFISHIHADHNLGLVKLLKIRQQLKPIPNQLLILGPYRFKRLLQLYSSHCERLQATFIPNGKYEDHSDISHLGLSKLTPVKVQHCYDAYGAVVVDAGTGLKVVFSGDTRPCEELVIAGENADLLIHEATFNDDLQEEAVTKKHCTISEALEVADSMNAKNTFLTHFSQRYPQLPVGHSQNVIRVGFAFDCMHVPLSQVDHVYQLVPVITETLGDNSDETEH